MNLVALIPLATPNTTISPSHRIYWGKIEGKPRDPRRAPLRRLEVRLLDGVEFNLKEGESVAILDGLTFVPERIPVLEALSFQRNEIFPFNQGALLNIGSSGDPPQSLDINKSIFLGDLTEQDLRIALTHALKKSDLMALAQIRDHAGIHNQLIKDLSYLAHQATLDAGQLQSFLESLCFSVHCTQGPPGTGKYGSIFFHSLPTFILLTFFFHSSSRYSRSCFVLVSHHVSHFSLSRSISYLSIRSYLGIVITRALLLIRSAWKQVAPSSGDPPILVLSYKNRAIDDFLMDLIDAFKRERRMSLRKEPTLIRVGRTDELKLKKYAENSKIAENAKLRAIKAKVREINDLHLDLRRISLPNDLEALELKLEAPADDVGLSQAEEMSARVEEQNAALSLSNALVFFHRLFPKALEHGARNNSDVCSLDLADMSHGEVRDVKHALDLHHDQSGYQDELQMITTTLQKAVSHYSFNPIEVLWQWMSGFHPQPPCSFLECTTPSLPGCSVCAIHRCQHVQQQQHRCENPLSSLRVKFCDEHLCSAAKCSSARLDHNQLYCDDHCCKFCLREVPGSKAALARDDPPRNTCERHVLCAGTMPVTFEMCENLAEKGDSYCLAHRMTLCTHVSPSGVRCDIAAMNLSKFCSRHEPKKVIQPRKQVDLSLSFSFFFLLVSCSFLCYLPHPPPSLSHSPSFHPPPLSSFHS